MQDRKPFSCFDRRYLVKLGIGTAAILAAGIGSKAYAVGSTGRLGLVGLESIAMGYIILITVATILRLDEMNQRIHLEAIAVSFSATAVLGTALGLMERAGLRVTGWEQSLWLFMALVWGLGVFAIQRRYR